MWFLILLLPISLSIPFSIQNTNASDIEGIWLTDDGRAKVEIFEEAGKYVGEIVWLDESVDENGEAVRDINNPDEEKQDREVLGLRVIEDLEYDGERWVNGEIYAPDRGETFDCVIAKPAPDELEVRGYRGMRALGETNIWTRAEE